MKRNKSIKSVFSVFGFSILVLALAPDVVFSQRADESFLDFPFSTEKQTKYGEGFLTLFIFVEEKHFNRDNLIKLFSYFATSRKETTLTVHVFSDRQILTRYYKNPPDLVGFLPATPEGEKARAEYFDKNRLPETGYFRAHFKRNKDNESFDYNPRREIEQRVKVTLRDSRRYSSSAELLITSVTDGYTDGVRSALNQGQNPNIKDTYGNTPLNLALVLHHHDITRQLVKAGADVNLRDAHGFPPIMVAADAGNYDVVKLLIDTKAHVNAVNNTGETAFFAAVASCHVDIVKLLLESGANPTVKNLKGETVRSFACKNRDILVLLDKFERVGEKK